MKKAEKAVAERKNCEQEIKKLDSKLQNIASDIDKNLDMLNVLEDHKRFMFNIFKKENAAWADEIVRRKEEKLSRIKREWIENYRQNRIVINEEDLPLEWQRSQDTKGKREVKPRTAGDAESLFDKLMAEDKIDVPQDFYEEEILFDEP